MLSDFIKNFFISIRSVFLFQLSHSLLIHLCLYCKEGLSDMAKKLSQNNFSYHLIMINVKIFFIIIIIYCQF